MKDLIDVRKAERVELRHLVGDRTEGGCHGAPLQGDIHPESTHTGNGVGGVELALRLEPLPLRGRKDAEHHLPDGLIVEDRTPFDGADGTVQPDRAWHLRGQVKVRGPDRHRIAEQVVDMEPHRRCWWLLPAYLVPEQLGGREGAAPDGRPALGSTRGESGWTADRLREQHRRACPG